MERLLIILLVVMLLVLIWAIPTQGPMPGPPPNDSTPAETTHTDPAAETTTQATTEATTVVTTQATTEATTEPTAEPTADPTTEPPVLIGEEVSKTAKAQVDKPYLYGGVGPDSFDTSGLVLYCFAENGISVPRGTSALAEHGREVKFEELQPGDVVFFWTDTPGKAQFVGIYVGDGQFISASSTKGIVRSMNITSSYYTEHYVTARRYTDA